jgi:uncharacterized protein (DUF58 family)
MRTLGLAKAEALAERLPPLMVNALKVASTMAQGVHGRRRPGMGDAFWQYRPFLPGDEAGRIDWRRSGRSDRLFIREREWEAAQTVYLWRAADPGMEWRSSKKLPLKRERAELLLLALATLLLRGGEKLALWGERPTGGRGALLRIADEMETRQESSALPRPIQLPRHAEAVLIGDFLSPIAEIEINFEEIATAGVRGHLLLLCDPAEEDLPYNGRVHFLGSNNQAEEILIPRVEPLADEYRRRFAAHRNEVRSLASKLGFTASFHRTDHSPESALLALYNGLG